jgi:hypothetical protein
VYETKSWFLPLFQLIRTLSPLVFHNC